VEVKLGRKIRKLHDKLQDTESNKKEVGFTLHGQREYYERKQQERDATREQVEMALYDMINKLHKQLEESIRASRQLEATLHHRREELRIRITETHFERERDIRQINFHCLWFSTI
jgi:hypothetical protein